MGLPRGPLGVHTLTPQLVGPSWSGEAAVCGPAESGPNPGKGPPWLPPILLTGLNLRLHLPQQPAITHRWHLSPSKG